MELRVSHRLVIKVSSVPVDRGTLVRDVKLTSMNVKQILASTEEPVWMVSMASLVFARYPFPDQDATCHWILAFSIRAQEDQSASRLPIFPIIHASVSPVSKERRVLRTLMNVLSATFREDPFDIGTETKRKFSVSM